MIHYFLQVRFSCLLCVLVILIPRLASARVRPCASLCFTCVREGQSFICTSCSFLIQERCFSDIANDAVKKKGPHVGPEYTVYPILIPFFFFCVFSSSSPPSYG